VTTNLTVENAIDVSISSAGPVITVGQAGASINGWIVTMQVYP